MKKYSIQPQRLSWQGGYGAAYLVRKDSQEWIIVGSDGFIETKYVSDVGNYIEPQHPIEWGFHSVEEGELKYHFRTVDKSRSNLTGCINIFFPVDVEVEEIPFHRVDIREDIRKRIFKDVPKYVVLYARDRGMVFLIKPFRVAKFIYICYGGVKKEGDLYLCTSPYIRRVHFRHFAHDGEVYAIRLWANASGCFWRVRQDGKEYNIFASEEEIIEAIKEGKFEKIV